ncbi:hypothetical protein ACS0TY_029555 [Phlomoides rotata]
MKHYAKITYKIFQILSLDKAKKSRNVSLQFRQTLRHMFFFSRAFSLRDSPKAMKF